IDIEYTNAEDFLKESTFGEHDAHISKLVTYAEESAIISRSNIDTEAFGSVGELADLLKHSRHANFSID
ncbi:kinase, partial [Aliarcobacter butzleri]